MFRTTIRSTPFTGASAEQIFQRFTVDSYLDDVSFRSTIRALLDSRVPQNETVRVRQVGISRSEEEVKSYSWDRILRPAIEAYESNLSANVSSGLIICGVNGSDAGNKKVFDLLDGFCGHFANFAEVEPVHAFFAPAFETRCFIDPNRRMSILFVMDLDIRRWHFIQCAIPALMPWCFGEGQKCNEEELKLVYSLKRSKKDDYVACLTAMAERYDFRSAQIRSLLSGFEAQADKISLETAKNNLVDVDRRIDDLQSRMREYLNNRNDALIRIMGLERKIEQAEASGSEIMDYFLANKSLDLVECYDDLVRWRVRCYLTYFDQEVAQRTIGNHSSYPYHYGVEEDDVELLLSELFLSDRPRIKIRFCSEWVMHLRGSVDAQDRVSFGDEYAGYMPNPHHYYHSCTGDWRIEFNNLMREHDYIGAVEHSCAATMSLAFTDGTVMSEFWQDLLGRNKRCIELPDGSVVKATEAIEWLKANPEE